MKDTLALIERLIALPMRDRSAEQIAQELGEPVGKVAALLESKPRMPEGFQLTSWINHLGVTHWLVLPPEKAAPTVQPRAYRYLRSKDYESYHRVFIPDDIVDEHGKPAKYIELFPFSDVHWGHRRCDEGNFLRDVKEVARRPNRFAFLNGDNMEMSLGDSAGGRAWAEQRHTPEAQRDQTEEVYRPIAHKTVVARTGNHDERPDRTGSGMNPLKEVCKALQIPYFRGPSNMEIVWQGYRWTFFMKHGTGASNTTGGKLNVAGKDRGYSDFRNFFIMGHVHDEITHKVNRSVRQRVFDEAGNLKEFWVEHRKEYKIICPSYLLYSGTYAEEHGYSPGSRNTIVIQLFANGDYHVVSSKRGQNAEQTI